MVLIFNFNKDVVLWCYCFYCNRKDVKTWDRSSNTWSFSLTVADKDKTSSNCKVNVYAI